MDTGDNLYLAILKYKKYSMLSLKMLFLPAEFDSIA